MAVNQQQMTSSRYIGALLAVGVGIPIPILGAFATLLGYFALSALSAPTTIIITFLPLLGLIFTIIVWLLLAFFFMPWPLPVVESCLITRLFKETWGS